MVKIWHSNLWNRLALIGINICKYEIRHQKQ